MYMARWSFSDKTRLPRDKAMERARKDTFGNWWPHDGEPGHGATSTNVRHAFLIIHLHLKTRKRWRRPVSYTHHNIQETILQCACIATSIFMAGRQVMIQCMSSFNIFLFQ
jgi:hypothetical protein